MVAIVAMVAMGGARVAAETTVALAIAAAVAVEVGSAGHTIDDSYGHPLQAGQSGWIRTRMPSCTFGNTRSGQ